MKLFGFELTRARAMPVGAAPVSPRRRGWPIVREPFTGAWQQNAEVATPSALGYPAVFACVTRIAADLGKLPLRLVSQDAEGIWTEASSPAFSPVLRRPNRYQTTQKFVEQWMVSKLTQGNAYVLKQRDARGVVVALYVLDPLQVTPLVAPDGAVFYQLGKAELAGLPEGLPVAVPASEIIHDPMVCLFHPLIGVTPLYAVAQTILQGQAIFDNATAFFANGSNPGGILLAPSEVSEADAQQIAETWQTKYSGVNAGRVAVLQNDMKYEPLGRINAVDAQLIEQLKLTGEHICMVYGVPVPLIDSAHPVPYANSEPLVQQYYSLCLQPLKVAFEAALDEGLGLTALADPVYGTDLDIDDLIWMDTATRTKAATDAISGGALSPNEARAKYFGLGSVAGGESPYLQQQQFSLAALAERDADAPFSKPAPAPPALPPSDDEDEDETLALAGLISKAMAA